MENVSERLRIVDHSSCLEEPTDQKQQLSGTIFVADEFPSVASIFHVRAFYCQTRQVSL